MRMVQENIDELIEDAEDYDLKLIKKFDIIENDLRDIKDLLDDIENSKIGKKIWNQQIIQHYKLMISKNQ